jgi:phage anti-repressor protein
MVFGRREKSDRYGHSPKLKEKQEVERMKGLKVIESGIVPVYEDKEARTLVNAREMHEFLGSGQEFANWIKNRIEKYSFQESPDFISFDKIIKREFGGGTTRTEYLLSIDMAKELAMALCPPRPSLLPKFVKQK